MLDAAPPALPSPALRSSCGRKGSGNRGVSYEKPSLCTMQPQWGAHCFSYGPSGTSSKANKSSWVWLAAVHSLISWAVSCPAGASTWDSIHTNRAHAKKGHVLPVSPETNNTASLGTAFLGDRDVQHQQQHSHNPGILSAHITPRTPGGTGCSAVPCPCSRCPGPGCVSMMGHIPLPHTCSCSAFQVTGPAAPDFSRLSHFWHLPSQSETQCFPLSPSIWNPGLEEFSY